MPGVTAQNRPAALLERAWGPVVLLRATTSLGERPDRLPRALVAALSQPLGLLAAMRASTARYPAEIAVAGAEEQITYRQLWTQAGQLAAGLAETGVSADSTVGILYRNSPMYVRLLLAVMMLGADVVFLNTGFGAEQCRATLLAEGVEVTLIEDLLIPLARGTRVIATAELETMLAVRPRRRRPRPRSQSRLIILTSGTTGRPRGAARPSAPDGLSSPVGSVLGPIPLRLRDTMVIPAPFFHAWGLGTMLLGLGLSATIVTHPEFDADATLAAVSAWRARTLVVVPAMLARICALPARRLADADTDALRIIASSGSAIPETLVTETLDRFGPVLYSVYGSTEMALAAIATPADLRAEPRTAGRPVPGVRVAVLDERGEAVPRGEVGRIFVGGPARFDGYTDGSTRESIDGLLGSGDVGHFDPRGRLFVDGREDDMIVSGGENVYPREIEDLLSGHDAVAEVAVIGVADDRFGQALKAFVVLRAGAQADPEALKRHVARGAARFKVPRSFVFLPALPRNATGKLLRRELT